jgi:uncharacterized repeat protein (TIGR01451 family)
LAGAALTTWLLWGGLAPAQAEGSKELTSNGGNRAYLTYTTKSYFGILEQTKVYVYVNAGETINLGSSANGVTGGKIQYTKPNGTIGTCTISSTVGRIVDRNQESAGIGSGGYTPCTIVVGGTEDGIWQIDFVSPNPGVRIISGTQPPIAPPSISATASWSSQSVADWFVTAWDVTVTSNNVVKTGRVYANYVALNIGANLDGAFQGIFYVVTKDGYHYQVKANGLDPYRFFFFSDSKGLYNTTTNNSIYRSIDLLNQPTAAISLPSGVAFLDPNTTTNVNNYSNKLFLNPIDPSIPSSTAISGGSNWLNPALAPPPPPTQITLVGSEGTTNQIGQNIGGTFQFNNPDLNPRPYQITLDLNGNNVFGDGKDRTLLGTAAPGANSVIWDGKDGNGDFVTSQIASFKTVVATLGGEVHFPLIDAESNISGLIITRLNGATTGGIASPSFNADRIYYNDTQMTGGSAGTPPNPKNATIGVDSNAGAHKWGASNANGFGDATIIDTWAYAPVFTPSTLSVVIKGADLQIAENLVGSLVKGQTTTYTIDVTNINDTNIGSISDAIGATVRDVLPAVFSNPKVISCQVVSGTGNCGTYGFTGNTFNATVDLNSGSKLRFEIQATLATSATGTVVNSATVFRPNDVGDPVDQDGLGGITNLSETATVSNSIAPTSGNANVLLVKRITAINGNRIQNPNDSSKRLDGIVHDSAINTHDSDTNKWPSTSYLVGATNAGKVKPGDKIEYTIYFVNNGNLDASGVRICDRITANQSFQLATYGGVNQDIQAQVGIAPILDLTAADDAPIDRTQVYAANATVPSTCNLKATNTNGTVDIPITGAAGTGVPNFTVIPGSIAPGVPSNSAGFVRFTTIVK